MQARPPLFRSPQGSLNHRARWTAARLPGLLFSVILGVGVAGCASLPTDVARPISTALANPGDTRLGRAITGGRNLGETYFRQSAGTNFIDIDLLAAGRMSRDLSRSFDQYWNNPLAYPVQSLMTAEEIEALKTPPPVKAETGTLPPASDLAGPQEAAKAASGAPAVAGSGGQANATTTARVVTSPGGASATLPALPDDTDLGLLTWTWAPSAMLVDKPSKIGADADSVEEAQDTTVDGLLQLMTQAQRDLLIVSSYFVPGERMMKQLEGIRQRGVCVRVLTNSLASNDAPAAHVGYARYREALLRLDIELYEMRAEHLSSVSSLGALGGSLGSATGGSRASLHAKVVVIDDRLLVVGSMNLDLRSQLQNSEVAIVVRNRAISLEATRLIEPALTNGAYRVELDGGQLVWRAPQNSGLKDTPIKPDASAGLKLLLKIIGPLAPDEML